MTIDTRILRSLRQAGAAGVAGTELSRGLGISRAAIWSHISDLRAVGYDIEASPHLGYRLVSAPDRLLADDLLSRLEGSPLIGRDIRVFRETLSTNEIMGKLARDEVAEGAVVFAESQTGGRGRLGRTWVSPAGRGLWFSVLLRPPMLPQEMTRLTVAAATSLARAINRQTGIRPEIKWPNDILIRGRKTAGILTEMQTEPDRIRHAILGIGVNVNLEPDDWPGELRRSATSLRIEAGEAIDRPALAVRILKELDGDYRKICGGGFAEIAAEWADQCSTLGQWVRVRTGGRVVRGRAESLDSDGALLVRNDHGQLDRIIGGDVTVEKSPERPGRFP